MFPPWKQIASPGRSTTTDADVPPNAGLKPARSSAAIGFPPTVQLLQLTRSATGRTKRKHTEVVYAVTSLSVTDATPAQVAGWIRGHWPIEVRREVALVERNDRLEDRMGGG